MKGILTAPFVFVRLMLQSIFLAAGQIWVNKTRSILTTLGIIIGVASVTAVVAATSGMNDKVMENFEIFGTKKIFLWPERPQTGSQKNIDWWQLRFKEQQFEGLLDHCPSVEHLSLVSGLGSMTARYGKYTVDGVRMQGVEDSWFEIENRSIVRGRPFSFLDSRQARRVCLITEKLKDKLRLDADCEGQIIQFDTFRFMIIGVLEERPAMMFGNQGEQLEVYIPFQTAQTINQSWIQAIAACRSTEVAEEARAEITFFLRKTRQVKLGEPNNFGVFIMENEVAQVRKVFGMISLVAGAVVSISLLVGGVGIMNIMLVSVSERTREIGLRKAVGANNYAILMQFLIEAVVLCLIGGAIGTGLGQLLAAGISQSAPLLEKTQVPGWAILLSFGFSAMVGIFFGMFPAIKAARLDPIEALRHE